MRDLDQTDQFDENNEAETLLESMRALKEEQVRLNDLFVRRLNNDRAKAAAYDELYRQLEWARRGLTQEAIRPLALRLLKLIDTLPEDSSNELLLAVRTELLSLLEENGLTEVVVGDFVDPSLHEIVDTTTGDAEPNYIVEVKRPGYTLGEHLLRPAQVVAVAREQEPG